MPANVVTKVAPNPKNDAWRTVTVDDKDFIVFSAKAADELEIGKPLPEGTEEEPPKFTGALPSLKLPWKKKGGGGRAESWNYSEAGVRYSQERTDRRTALMQGVEFHHDTGAEDISVLREADYFYAWLRASDSPSIGAAEGAPITSAVGGGGTRTDPKPPERPVTGMGKAQPVEGGGAETSGLDAASSPTICEHIHTSPLRPDGTEMPISKVRCLDCGKAVPA